MTPMRVAVVGGGVSGLGAGYVLARAGHEVHLFERTAKVGGHVNTVVHDSHALDTGFIVSNARNYPLLTRLFAELGVTFRRSEMSFSVACDACGLEYAGRRPFAQWRNAGSAQFTSLLWEIGRWLRTVRASVEDEDWEDASLGDYLAARRYSAPSAISSRRRAACRSSSRSFGLGRRVRSHHSRCGPRIATASGQKSRLDTTWIVPRMSVAWIALRRSRARVSWSRSNPSRHDQSRM